MSGHPPPTTVQVFSCKDWVIDLNQRELRLAGSVVPAGGRAFDILEALVRSAGRPLSRSELIGCVWAGQVVAPGVLKVQVFALRKAFGADRGLIRTVGSGYCLTGDWQAGDRQAGAAPAVPDMRQHPPNLPLVTSWLVGRGDAMAACRSLMLDHRALTLIGPGGIGKTSLAVELARQTTGDVPSDAWLVELAPLADPRLVPSAVANVLGLRIEPEGISPESVAGAIGQRNLLLVLDNCEHVIDAVADLAEAIDHVSDGRSHGLARIVPAYPRRHCGAASAAARTMLSAAVTACVYCRQGNCVHLSLDPAESPAGRQSLAGGAGRGRRPGAFGVAKAVGRRVDHLSDGRVGRPSGECRLT